MTSNTLTSWKEEKIGDLFDDGTIVEIQDGNHGELHPKSSDYVYTGIPFIMANDIVEGAIDWVNCKKISKDLADNLRIGFAKPGDILLTHKGSIGNVAVIPDDIDSEYVMLTPQVTYYRTDNNKINPLFLAYSFRSQEFQQQIYLYSQQSTRPYIGITAQRNLSIKLPNIDTQKKITSVLYAHDDLIQNNQKRIAILEEMAQLLYREWFVEFRFPGYKKAKFIDSELGKIPEGWKVGIVNDILTIKSGFPFKSTIYIDDGQYKIITIGNVGDRKFDPVTNDRINILPKKLPQYCILDDGDILISLTGNIGRVCLVYGNDKNLLNQRVGKVTLIKKGFRGFAYTLLNSYYLKKYLENISNGAAQQNLSPIEAGKLNVNIPEENILLEFNDVIDPLLKEIVVLNNQNLKLSSMRDLLLPKLMSGEIDVSKLDINITNN